MDISLLDNDAEIEASFAVMSELRTHLRRESYVATIRGQQAAGYLLAGGFVDDTLVALAGYRFSQTLFRGPHVFVDDLVTTASAHGRGHGTAMLAWVARAALERDIDEVWLDSRATAKGFYAKLGFELRTSIPCSIAATTLAAKANVP